MLAHAVARSNAPATSSSGAAIEQGVGDAALGQAFEQLDRYAVGGQRERDLLGRDVGAAVEATARHVVVRRVRVRRAVAALALDHAPPERYAADDAEGGLIHRRPVAVEVRGSELDALRRVDAAAAADVRSDVRSGAGEDGLAAEPARVTGPAVRNLLAPRLPHRRVHDRGE